MNNSFWREVFDYIPGFFMLFRVDKAENAHLIFVNSQVQELLGFTPEEYVLAFESLDSTVYSEITGLIEQIAELSHNGRGHEEPICRLRSAQAVEHLFYFEFRVFSVKSNPLPFIAVSLKPVAEHANETKKAESLNSETERSQFFVAESSLMKSLIRKVKAVADQNVHLLFRGERSTGKRTLARQVLEKEKINGAICVEWDLLKMSSMKQNEAVSELCGAGVEGRDQWEESGIKKTVGQKKESNPPDGHHRLSLLIIEPGKLSASNQEELLRWLQDRSIAGKQTRVLATSREPLEELIKRNKFSPELYYLLGFDTILLPPLSHRKDDIRILIEEWLPGVAKVLELEKLKIPKKDITRLLHYDWPGNFDEFFKVIRRSLLQSQNGVFRADLESPVSDVAAPKAEMTDQLLLSSDEILLFDEMNRRYLERVLRKTDGKIYGKDGAAHLLGMKPTTLQSKLKKLGVR
ncbi:MAG: sigma 54-interacting transcriptional regulator [Balneolales bacterium]